jgi:putative transposase
MTTEQIKVICKNCNSEHVIRYGSYKGMQRYYCKDCKRKFKGDAALFHMKVSASHISSALSMYYTGSSITDIRNHIRQETGYHPSKSVVFGWIEKYTEQASEHFRKFRPQVGDRWIADETMIDLDKGKNVWFWDIIDADTRFLLASRVSISRTAQDAKSLIQDAVKKAGKAPKLIITDRLKSYPDGIYTALGGATEHLQSSPFKIASESTSKIERFHSTLKERTKVMKAFRDIETLISFADGFLVYYNFLKPHESLEGKTPAEKAKVRYTAKTWVEVVNAPVSKQVEVSTHISPRMPMITPRTPVDKAFRRQRITPKPPRLPHQRVFPLGGIYTDKSGRLLSRRHKRGWRKLR